MSVPPFFRHDRLTVDPRPQLEPRQRRHKAVFDRGARELTKLQVGKRIRMRHNHVWVPAIVVQEDGHPRSYIVKRSETEYRRKRRDILQTAEVVSQDDDPIDDSIVAAPVPVARSTWRASAKTLRISTKALVFPAAEYCAPVWSRSPHVKKVDVASNSCLRSISGCPKPTPVFQLPVLAGIAPAGLRRKAAALALARKAVKHDWHILLVVWFTGLEYARGHFVLCQERSAPVHTRVP